MVGVGLRGMGKKLETTIIGYMGFSVQASGFRGAFSWGLHRGDLGIILRVMIQGYKRIMLGVWLRALGLGTY